MKLNWLACGVIGCVFSLVSSCWGEENVTILEAETKAGVTVQLEVYPKCLMYGDSLFCATSLANETETEKLLKRDEARKVRIRCHLSGEEPAMYEYLHQKKAVEEELVNFTPMMIGEFFMLREFCRVLPVPRLGDWENPFWQNVREILKNTEEIELQFEITFLDSEDKTVVEFQFPITLKARPDREMEWIRAWFETTPEKVLAGGERPYKSALFEEWEYFIEINGADFYPWGIVAGEMPSGAGIPKTLIGWRNLEKMLSPGTLRDQVSMTRRVIETLENPETGLNPGAGAIGRGSYGVAELKEWLATLPNVERRGLVSEWYASRIYNRNMLSYLRNATIPSPELMEYLYDDYFYSIAQKIDAANEVLARYRLLYLRLIQSEERQQRDEKAFLIMLQKRLKGETIEDE
ncbi:MAG: hypothetical protein Q4C70_06780 [Planctomycetia bacterium]|nr:hypothetical protein [Planctomycetia bacterium]